MQAPRALALALVALVASSTALAVDTPLISCTPSGGGDNFSLRGFYVPNYPGVTLRDVTLYVSFPRDGAYSLTLTARRNTFDGALIGTASAGVSVTGDRSLPVTFGFGNVAVPSGITITFEPVQTSGPDNPVFFQTAVATGCPVVGTDNRTPPLGTFRRSGLGIIVNGTRDPQGVLRTITIPAVASIHGRNDTFFHSDVNLFNRSSVPLTVNATYRCYAGQSCGSGTASFPLAGFTGKSIADVVTTLFGAPETAGALELTYRTTTGLEDDLHTVSRVYTPSLPAPTNGAEVRGYPESAATGLTLFVGLANNGGNLASGFRTNTGVYNPWGFPTSVEFAVVAVDGITRLGTVTQSWGPHEARQINDIFAAVGAAATVTTDAILYLESTLPVFSYVTVVDNVTGDSVVQGPTYSR